MLGSRWLGRSSPSASCLATSAPYAEQEVAVTNGPIRLAGTLTIPVGAGPFPVVVMITGSGAQNRDEEVFGFKVFRVLGERLARYVLSKEGKESEQFDPLLALLRSEPNERAAALLQEGLDEQFVRPLARWLGGERAEERAGLIAQEFSIGRLGKSPQNWRDG